MTILSFLNGDNATSSKTRTSKLSKVLESLNAKQPTTTVKKSEPSPIYITIDAKRAANAKADARKAAATIAAEARASFDSQQRGNGRSGTVDLAAASARSLSVIAMNDRSLFSSVEVAAAIKELRNRDRDAAMATITSSSFSAKILATYTQDLLLKRESMSAEEVQLRTTTKLR
jgi:hypothetical protein